MEEPVDDFTQRIMERARERREMLTKKMADNSSRKRSSPLSVNQSENMEKRGVQDNKEDSPNKRYCAREEEQNIHSDTPAIIGVKSRMQNLMSTRRQWFTGEDSENQMEVNQVTNEMSTHLQQPNFGDSPTAPPRSGRKERLAALANSVNNWEDDLSHPTIKQDVKPKKVWQPQTAEANNPLFDQGPAKPPRTYEHDENKPSSPKAALKDFNNKPRRFVSPARGPLEDAVSPPKMNRSEASSKNVVSSMTVMLGRNVSGGAAENCSKTFSTSTTVLAKSPSRGRNVEIAQKSPGKVYESKTEVNTVPSPTRRDLNRVKSGPRVSDVHEPTKKPVLERLACWQQKVESVEAVNPEEIQSFKTPKTTLRQTPRSPGSVLKPPSSASKPVQNLFNTTLADDPLNMSIHSRMNVWETKIKDSSQDKESSNQILHGTPRGIAGHTRTVSGCSKFPISTNQHMTPKPAQTISGGNIQSKSSSSLATPVGSKSPSKIAVSPRKVAEGTRTIHEKLTALHQQWSNNDISEKIKQQKEAELEQVKNRWKNGVLQEQDERQKLNPKDMPDIVSHPVVHNTAPPPAPPLPPSTKSSRSDLGPNFPNKQRHRSPKKQKTPVHPKREQMRNEMRKEDNEENYPFIESDALTTERKNFEDKLQMMGFEMNTSHSAEIDLTPYKERQKAELAKKPPTPNKQSTAQAKLQIEEKRTTTVKFDDKEKVTIHRNKIITPCVEEPLSMVSGNMSYTPSRHATMPPKAPGTPSIYSLIKKNTIGNVPMSPYARPAASQGSNTLPAKTSAKSHGNSFSDDSFESHTSMETEEDCPPSVMIKQPSPVRRASPMKKAATPPRYGGSQLSLTSATSEYSETPSENGTTTQDEYDSVSETDDYTEATETTQSEEDESIEDSEEDDCDVSDLLDEALSDDEPSEVYEEPQPVTAASPRRVQMRQNSTARSARPISQPPEENRRRAANTEDYYKCVGQRNSAPSHPKKSVKFAGEYSGSDYTSAVSSSHSSSESEREDASSRLAYSIDAYRQSKSKVNAPVPKMTIVRQPEHHRHVEQEQPAPKAAPIKPNKQRLQDLQDRINQEQSVIMQTSNALNQCCGQNMQFAGSDEAVECHKLLLIACKKREAYINEMHRLKHGQEDYRQGPQGSLTISNISLPLKQEFRRKIGGPNDLTVHYFLLLLRHRDHVVFGQMVKTHNEKVVDSLDIPNLIKFNNIKQDFKVDVEVYGMSVTRENPNQTPNKKKKGPFTPKKLLKKGPLHIASPGGPSAVRSTNFVLVAHMQLHAKSQGKNHFMLENVPFSSPLQGSIHLRMQCLIESSVEEKGFLTMFEDVSGFGAWHRRWFALKQGYVSFWKYPDDEKYKEPLGYFDLKQCITDAVGLIPRDICARPNTFELITVRRQSRGETDTLVSRCYNTMTTTKHWLSADTKEERILWCNRLNEALDNIRTWHTDALRPIRRNDMVTQYNPYPSKSDQRECIVPFNPHDQQSAC